MCSPYDPNATDLVSTSRTPRDIHLLHLQFKREGRAQVKLFCVNRAVASKSTATAGIPMKTFRNEMFNELHILRYNKSLRIAVKWIWIANSRNSDSMFICIKSLNDDEKAGTRESRTQRECLFVFFLDWRKKRGPAGRARAISQSQGRIFFRFYFIAIRSVDTTHSRRHIWLDIREQEKSKREKWIPFKR